MQTQVKHILAGSIAAVLFIAGCANKDDALGEGAKKIDKKALQALNIQGAPNWVLNGGQGDMSAVGIADIVNGDLGFARTEALALARDELARQVGTKIQSTINRAANVSMGASTQDAQVSKTSEQITKQTVSQTLSGSKQTDTWITKDATKLFVLIKLNPELKAKLEANVKKEINKSTLYTQAKQDAINAVSATLSTAE
ncbi:LPP20 family lipoprotein [uncultured Helicobacter sp.]|uniref:LPP20 family lipoprotein n=1 Tax=uncultured Helicobacter sp. TaxID=175537 RepID=UPI0026359908|nr:LPP20 family lipoprotein [uncultured Helicobacter sp.]